MAQEITRFQAIGRFFKVGTCSEALCNLINRAYEHPLVPEENATLAFAGGVLQHGYQCGMLWGAALAAGAEAYRRFGAGPKAESAAIIASGRAVAAFRPFSRDQINCMEITDIDKTSGVMKMLYVFLLKGGTIRCFRRAGRYAPVALKEIEAALSDPPDEPIEASVSCASLVVKNLGGTEQQCAMAAGLAGGIGLCGGACGALGAAIWMFGMSEEKKGNPAIKFKDPRVLAIIEKYLKASDYTFECEAVAGRKFKNPADHAAYLRDGGCKGIIEALSRF